MAVNKYVRRRILPKLTVAAAATLGANAIEWGSTTSSTSDFLLTANVGEILEVSFFAQRWHRAHVRGRKQRAVESFEKLMWFVVESSTSL